jgi:hypothetical protein
MPLIGSIIGIVLSLIIGLDVGTGFLLTVLISSSSYIVVTAAMRAALPQAKAAIYIIPSKDAAKKIGSNIVNFNRFTFELNLFKEIITIPTFVVGIN